MAKKIKKSGNVQSVQGAEKVIKQNKARTQAQLDAIFGKQDKKKS